MNFKKVLVDPLTNIPGPAITWGKSFMVPPGDKRLLGGALADLMEDFVATFQGVNQGACG